MFYNLGCPLYDNTKKISTEYTKYEKGNQNVMLPKKFN